MPTPPNNNYNWSFISVHFSTCEMVGPVVISSDLIRSSGLSDFNSTLGIHYHLGKLQYASVSLVIDVAVLTCFEKYLTISLPTEIDMFDVGNK